MRDGLRMRAARDDEEEELIRLMISSIRHNCVQAYGQDTVDAWTDQGTSRFDFRVPLHSFVAEFGGRAVGFSGWLPQKGENDLARVAALFVAPGKGRRGIGRAMMIRVQEHIAESGFARIHLFASLNSVPLYLAMGYEELAREQAEVAEGYHIELVHMACDIDALPETE